MTLAEAGEIFAYWEQSPPAHLMLQTLARMLGWAPPAPASDTPPLGALAMAPPPGLAVAHDGGLGMPEPVLDAAALRARNLARAVAMARQNDAAADD
jgi:hypothetical protein